MSLRWLLLEIENCAPYTWLYIYVYVAGHVKIKLVTTIYIYSYILYVVLKEHLLSVNFRRFSNKFCISDKFVQ